MKNLLKIKSITEQLSVLRFSTKWLFICLIVGILSGSASAIFLFSLEWATNWRESHIWIILFLPIAGLIIGLTYHYLGQSVSKGNNLLLDEIHEPKNIIPFKMLPLVLFSTITTHLFGGSSGREGTAVQMGGAIADQLTKVFKLIPEERKILLIAGISAGFASIFGTPIAGTIFALEVFMIGKISYEALLPSLFSAIIADYVCHLWSIQHTHYSIPFIPKLSPIYFLYAILAGIIFGLTSILFTKATNFWDNL
ncbi:MAG: chloride channel protein, partial [Candidatus Sericytochromatia bacterium]|nr:chloride channel protein [Candidatus Sericytochromatia bacterium]